MEIEGKKKGSVAVPRRAVVDRGLVEQDLEHVCAGNGGVVADPVSSVVKIGAEGLHAHSSRRNDGDLRR